MDAKLPLVINERQRASKMTGSALLEKRPDDSRQMLGGQSRFKAGSAALDDGYDGSRVVRGRMIFYTAERRELRG